MVLLLTIPGFLLFIVLIDVLYTFIFNTTTLKKQACMVGGAARGERRFGGRDFSVCGEVVGVGGGGVGSGVAEFRGGFNLSPLLYALLTGGWGRGRLLRVCLPLMLLLLLFSALLV